MVVVEQSAGLPSVIHRPCLKQLPDGWVRATDRSMLGPGGIRVGRRSAEESGYGSIRRGGGAVLRASGQPRPTRDDPAVGLASA